VFDGRVESELAEWHGQYVSERPAAGAGDQQAEGKQQFGERIFEAALIDVEAVRQVDEKDGAEHDDYRAGCADSQKRPGKNGEASGYLSEADEIADGRWRVHESGKVRRTRSTENAKENAAAVVEEWERAGYAHDKQGKIELL
jgi:hypothetical protein